MQIPAPFKSQEHTVLLCETKDSGDQNPRPVTAKCPCHPQSSLPISRWQWLLVSILSKARFLALCLLVLKHQHTRLLQGVAFSQVATQPLWSSEDSTLGCWHLSSHKRPPPFLIQNLIPTLSFSLPPASHRPLPVRDDSTAIRPDGTHNQMGPTERLYL